MLRLFCLQVIFIGILTSCSEGERAVSECRAIAPVYIGDDVYYGTYIVSKKDGKRASLELGPVIFYKMSAAERRGISVLGKDKKGGYLMIHGKKEYLDILRKANSAFLLDVDGAYSCALPFDVDYSNEDSLKNALLYIIRALPAAEGEINDSLSHLQG